MAKAKGGSKTSYTSKGEVRTISKKTSNAIRREYMGSMDRVLNQQKALKAGRDIVMTIENPNKEETNKRLIRVRVSGKDHVKNLKPFAMRKDVVDGA